MSCKIAIAVGSFPELSETFIAREIAQLTRSGFEVVVYCDEENIDAGFLERWGIDAEKLSVVRKWPQFVSDGFNRYIAGRSVQWKVQSVLDCIFSRNLVKADIVVAHFGPNALRVSRVLSTSRSYCRFFPVFHGADVGRPKKAGNLAMYHPVIARSEKAFCVNQKFIDDFVSAGMPRSKFLLRHLGVEGAQSPDCNGSRDENPYQLLTVGRLTQKKGMATTIRALAALVQINANLPWSLSIIGQGEERDRLKLLTETLGIADRVKFLGAQPYEVVIEEMDKTGFFILMSQVAEDGDVEGIPTVLMEAMSFGKVCISTRHSGIPELIDHRVDGILVDEGDASAAAEAIVGLTEDAFARKNLGNCAILKVKEKFDLYKNTQEFILSIMGSPRGTGIDL